MIVRRNGRRICWSRRTNIRLFRRFKDPVIYNKLCHMVSCYVDVLTTKNLGFMITQNCEFTGMDFVLSSNSGKPICLVSGPSNGSTIHSGLLNPENMNDYPGKFIANALAFINFFWWVLVEFIFQTRWIQWIGWRFHITKRCEVKLGENSGRYLVIMLHIYTPNMNAANQT